MTNKRPGKKKTGRVVSRAVKYILSIETENFRNINGKTLAYGIKANYSYLIRAFKQEISMSLPDFIKREAMNRAAFILMNQDIDVKKTAGILGYTRASRFEKEFESFWLIKPSRYKQIKQQMGT